MSRHTRPSGSLENDNVIKYGWTSGFIVPHELIDILCTQPDIEPADKGRDLSTEVDNMLDMVYEDDSDDDSSV